jgi:hypothetical protein
MAEILIQRPSLWNEELHTSRGSPLDLSSPKAYAHGFGSEYAVYRTTAA